MAQPDRPDQKRKRPDIVLDAETQLAIQLGQALEAVVQSAPWETLTEVLAAHSKDVGRYGLRDKEQTREYWAGYQDGIDYVLDAIPRFVLTAKARLADAEKDAEANNEADIALLGHFVGRTHGEVSGGE